MGPPIVALLPALAALAPLTPAPSGRRAAVAAPTFGDPLGLYSKPVRSSQTAPAALPILSAAVFASASPQLARAASSSELLAAAQLDPSTFQPVCPASDGFYRFGQSLVEVTVGAENAKEYAPLIAGGLLRVRLELCVVESFFYEAIIPFIKKNGLSWVLPLHETVETFLAGTVFAVASNFILIGSTKLVTVIFTYADVFIGLPMRIVGGGGWRALEDNVLGERAKLSPPEKRPWWKGPKPRPEVDIDEVWASNSQTTVASIGTIAMGTLFGAGLACKSIRQIVENLDVFVGRYLLLTTVGYVAIKFVHFKIWDPFPLV